MSTLVASLNFLEFYSSFKAQFNPASSITGEDQSNRFTIEAIKDPGRTIPIPKPDLPADSMRNPAHLGHEDYCEFHLFILMCIRDGAHWEEVTAAAEEAWKVSPLKKHFGPFHLAYFDFIESFEAKACRLDGAGTSTRTARLLKRDGDAITSEVVAHLDAYDFDPVKLKDQELEAWMVRNKHLISPTGSIAQSTEVSQVDLDAVHDYYLGLDALLVNDNWIDRMASRDGVIADAVRPRVDLARLNSEQRVALSKLLEHYHAREDADANGAPAPAPLYLIIYGLGGTGKSFVLRAFQQIIDDEADAASLAPPPSKAKVCVMAPTGTAAAGVHGETYHTCLQFPRKVENARRLPDDIAMPAGSKRLSKLQARHLGIDYYFVDEFGMLGMESWGAVDQRLRQAHATPTKPFGGRSVIVFGHHAQLPPVHDDPVHCSLATTTTTGKKRKPKKLTSLETNGLYVHGLFQDAVILRSQERQRLVPGVAAVADRAARVEYDLYQGILGRIMSASVTPQDWVVLDGRSRSARADLRAFSADGKGGHFRVPRICASCATRDAVNLAALLDHCATTGHPLVRIDAVHTGGPGAAIVSESRAGGLETSLILAKGAPVRCSWNGWTQAGLVNGALGTVHDVIYNRGEGPPFMPIAVLVQFPLESGYLGTSYLDDVPRVVKFTPRTEGLTDASKRPGSRRQFPLKLAFASTIHSFQGRTEDRVGINLGSSEFSHGLAYVSSSRVRQLDHMFFDPMPPLSRFVKHRKGLWSRFVEEARIEGCFYRTIQAGYAACVKRVRELDTEPSRQVALQSIVRGDDYSAYIPCRWKYTPAQLPRKAIYQGGGARSVRDALSVFVDRCRACAIARGRLPPCLQASSVPLTPNGSLYTFSGSKFAKIAWKQVAIENARSNPPDARREENYCSMITTYKASAASAAKDFHTAFHAAQEQVRAHEEAASNAKETSAAARAAQEAARLAVKNAAAATLEAAARELKKARDLVLETAHREEGYVEIMSRVTLKWGLPLFPGYTLPPAIAGIAPGVPMLDLGFLSETLEMRMRITDYLDGAETSLQWRNLARWATSLGFEVARDHSAVQYGCSCAIVAAKISVDLHDAADFMTSDTTYAASEECLRLSNTVLAAADLVDQSWTEFPCSALHTRFMSDEEGEFVANYWNEDVPTSIHDGGWLRWSSFDHFVSNVAKTVALAAVGQFVGKRFYVTNTLDSRFQGSHWVPVVIEILPKSPDLAGLRAALTVGIPVCDAEVGFEHAASTAQRAEPSSTGASSSSSSSSSQFVRHSTLQPSFSSHDIWLMPPSLSAILRGGPRELNVLSTSNSLSPLGGLGHFLP